MGNKESKTRGPYTFLCCRQRVKLAKKAEQQAFPSYSGWNCFFFLVSWAFFRKKIYVCEISVECLVRCIKYSIYPSVLIGRWIRVNKLILQSANIWIDTNQSLLSELLLAYTELCEKRLAPSHMLLGFSLFPLNDFVQCTDCTTVHDCTLRQETGPSIMPLDWKIFWRIKSWAGFKGNSSVFWAWYTGRR